jgi:hypothetical protein
MFLHQRRSARELEKDLNGVGAPLVGLVRSTKTDLTLSVVCLAVAAATGAWFAS